MIKRLKAWWASRPKIEYDVEFDQWFGKPAANPVILEQLKDTLMPEQAEESALYFGEIAGRRAFHQRNPLPPMTDGQEEALLRRRILRKEAARE